MSEAAPLICECCGQVRMDQIDRRLLRLRLTPTEMSIANMLSRFAPQFVTEDELIEFLWANDPTGGPDWPENCVRVSLHRLDKKLSSVGLKLVRQRYRKRFTIAVDGEVHPDV